MAIRWEKLTVKAQEAVQRGNDLASEHGNPELLPLHLLAALLEDKEGIVQPVLPARPVHHRSRPGVVRQARIATRRHQAEVATGRGPPRAGDGEQMFLPR